MDKVRYFLKALFQLYLTTLRETFRAFIVSWRFLFIHLLLVLAGALLLPLTAYATGIGRSLLLGFISALLLSTYWVTVAAAVSHERVSHREVFRRAQNLFPRVLGLLFFLFLITFSVHTVTRSLNLTHSLELLILANLCIAISWNTIFETAYQDDEDAVGTIRRAWAFMGENALEWFLPLAFVNVAVGVFIGVEGMLRLTVSLFATHPVQLLELLFRAYRAPEIHHVPFLGLLLVLVYLIFLFRGVLYKHLSRSNRRKRIFDARFL